MKYPKWPWISFAICCFLWLSFSGWQAEIEDEARPILNELQRMGSFDYQLGSGIESFLRGYMGDPFGKASEEYYKASILEDQLSQLAADYESASGGASLFLILTLVFAGLWIWKHKQYKKDKA